MKLTEEILQRQSSFEQFCSQFDWYDFKILSSFLTKLDYPFDTTTQSLHSIWQLASAPNILRRFLLFSNLELENLRPIWLSLSIGKTLLLLPLSV